MAALKVFRIQVDYTDRDGYETTDSEVEYAPDAARAVKAVMAQYKRAGYTVIATEVEELERAGAMAVFLADFHDEEDGEEEDDEDDGE